MRAVAHRADSGNYTATDERGELERERRVDLHACTLGHDGLFAEGRGAERGEQRRAIAGGAVRLRERVIEPVLAQLGMPVQAEEARAIGRDPRQHDVVARFERRHVFAGRDDDAGTLVPEHGRERMGDRPVLYRQIRTAHPARGHADMYVVAAERTQCDIVGDELVAGRAQHCRADRQVPGVKRSGSTSAWRIPSEKWMSS